MATQPALHRPEPSSGILQRLGLLRDGMAGIQPATSKATNKAEARARRRLLNDIRSFLIDNDLEVSPFNLFAAYEACAGLNPGFGRQVEQRMEEGLPITQDWLDETTAGAPQGGGRSVQALADKLEHGIDELSRATKTVRRVTSKYGNELERQVDGLQGAEDPEQVIANLADFAKAMLARSRQTEEELRASERETASLRKNLDRARRDAAIDYLTGLPNRRAFEEVLRADHREAAESGRSLSVAFCDIDRFKAINDSHGHEAGDRIIREIAETLSNLCGEDCYIARHGGEEFVMLFRGVAPAEALLRLDDAREDLARRRMINRRTEKPFGVVTFSGGIAEVSQFADPREALAAADQALYRAKEGGRNRICLAGEDDTDHVGREPEEPQESGL